LKRVLSDAFPREIAAKLITLARPAVRLWPQPLDARALMTCSRFGGLPAVPKDGSWSTARYWSRPRWFIAQINCADLVEFPSTESLPRDGLLSFFGDRDMVMGCDGGGQSNGVFYSPTVSDLDLAVPPTEDFKILPSCGLGLTETMDLPHPFSAEIQRLAFDRASQDRYHDLREAVCNYGVDVERYSELDRSKLLGWPDLVQGELGINENWSQLLLQVGHYDNGVERWDWGPGGVVYFVIAGEHLSARRFERVICDMQGT
jgi:uncharacterized protein YwqG